MNINLVIFFSKSVPIFNFFVFFFHLLDVGLQVVAVFRVIAVGRPIVLGQNRLLNAALKCPSKTEVSGVLKDHVRAWF